MLEHYIFFSITDNPEATKKRQVTNKIPLFTFYTHFIKMFTTLYLGVKNHR